MNFLFKNITWHADNDVVTGDVRITGNSIAELGDSLPSRAKEQVVDFHNHFLYPGLINSHDHLEMNHYPRLGNPPYEDYLAWTRDIYKPNESPIKEIEKADLGDRLLWGGIKNLVSGVTTVVHHNPWHRSLGKSNFPVRVLKKMTWSHSLQFGKNIKSAISDKREVPFVIHAAEGISAQAFGEINELNKLGLLKSNSVLVHAVGATDADIDLLNFTQSSVVWCPSSNLYMFETTAPVQKMHPIIKVALGSDSTLTGSPTLLDEMKIAHQTKLVNDKTLVDMVTKIPSSIFNVATPSTKTGVESEFMIVPKKRNDYFENLVAIRPSDILLVMSNGKLKLVDASLDIEHKLKEVFFIEGQKKFTETKIDKLKGRLEKKIGRTILEKNPLWRLIET